MKKIKLDKYQIYEIIKLADEKRRQFGFIGRTPVANDIQTILEELNIKLLQLPIESKGDECSFSAAIMYNEEEDLTFIGINTDDYFDKQIFSICHELYHYFLKSGYHLSRLQKGQDDLLEAKANRFAAEFLLPQSELKNIIFEEFKTESLNTISNKALIRFIARLYCKWWLPYHSILLRLLEVSAISKKQFDEIYDVDERKENSEFARICKTINSDIYIKLNTKTKKIGASADLIEIIIKNFEDGLISEDDFEEKLKLFNLSPNDFGYEIKIDQSDIDELNEFFDE